MKTQQQKPSAAESAQHTPAPWTAADSGVFSEHLNGHGNFYVAALPFPSEEPTAQDKANLALIAAAPDLLALAHAVQRAINAHDCEHPDFLDSCADVCQMLDEMAGDVRNAIDKAEGRARAGGKEVAGR